MKPAILIAAALLAGCTTTQYNDGSRVTLKSISEDAMQRDATEICIGNGKRTAVLIHTHSLGAAELGLKLATFACR